MAKKKKKPPEGAPDWLLTYGDMMSLLLCFFIILVSLSEIKKEDQYKAIVEEIKSAFGMKGGGGVVPAKFDPKMSVPERIEDVQLPRRKEKNKSQSPQEGVTGKTETVRALRPAEYIVKGGPIPFEPGSSRLLPEHRQMLRQIADEIRGHRTKLEIRGHAAPNEVVYADVWTLSTQRARAVMAYLTSDEVGLDPARMRLVSCGDHEVVVQRAFPSNLEEKNRRVEVVETTMLVEDLDQSYQE